MRLVQTTNLSCYSLRRPIMIVFFAISLAFIATGCMALSTVMSGSSDPGMMDSGGNAGGGAAAASPGHYVPAAFGSALDPTPVPSPTYQPPPPEVIGPPLPPPTVVVAMPPIDFDAARADAQAKGLDIAFVKIGFHRGPGGNAEGFGGWLSKLNDAGVPFFIKSVDAAGPIFEGQNIMKANEAAGRFVPHTLVYRSTDKKYEDPYYNLSLSPEAAAAVSWQLNRDAVPSELEKEYYWLETLNEPGRLGNDGNYQMERLGRFSLATAKMAVAEGYRYAAFAFSTGVPEPEDWEHPAMLDFLRYAGEHPDQVAVALHEYSLTVKCIAPPCSATPEPGEAPHIPYPYLVGRFQTLFAVCDKYGIPRPTVLITEWGWEYNSVPEPVPAIEDIAWASWLYAAYPQVIGAAIWYLGPWCCSLDDKTQLLIEPLTDYAVSHYFVFDPGIGQIDPDLFQPNPPTLLGVEQEDILPTPFPRPRTPVP